MSVVVITGCSTGIGLETALAFARRGDTTIATMRNLAKATTLRERAAAEGLAVDVVEMDVTDGASIAGGISGIEARHGAIDVLVNNAGVSYHGAIEIIEEAQARALFETNVWGPVRAIRAVLPGMRARRRGVIVNVSSVAGRLPGGGHSSFYAASKHALGTLSEGLSWEVEPFGVRVVCIEPGFFATEVLASGLAGTRHEAGAYAADEAWTLDFYRKSMAAGSGHPSVVANAILAATVDPATPLHVLVGDDARGFVSLVEQLGSFEATRPVLLGILESVAGPRPSGD